MDLENKSSILVKIFSQTASLAKDCVQFYLNVRQHMLEVEEQAKVYEEPPEGLTDEQRFRWNLIQHIKMFPYG